MSLLVNKILFWGVKHYLNKSELFNLRSISKRFKKCVHSSIKHDELLRNKLNCAKISTNIDHILTSDNTLDKVSYFTREVIFDIESIQYVRTKKCQFDELFNTQDHILTFEQHKFSRWYPHFGLIEIDEVIIGVDNDEFEFNLFDNHESEDLIIFLHHDLSIINLSIDELIVDNFTSKIYSLKIKDKFLSSKHLRTDDTITCKLFWWYRKFPTMPTNGTTLKQLILDKNNKIKEIVHYNIEDDFLCDQEGNKFHRSFWSLGNFDQMPLFINY